MGDDDLDLVHVGIIAGMSTTVTGFIAVRALLRVMQEVWTAAAEMQATPQLRPLRQQPSQRVALAVIGDDVLLKDLLGAPLALLHRLQCAPGFRSQLRG
jgi:hypothetical protein